MWQKTIEHRADEWDAMQIEGLEAHVGRRGRIRVKGGLPLTADGGTPPDAAALQAAGSDAAKAAAAKDPSALIVDVHGLELRLRNVYTGTAHCHTS